MAYNLLHITPGALVFVTHIALWVSGMVNFVFLVKWVPDFDKEEGWTKFKKGFLQLYCWPFHDTFVTYTSVT